VGGRAAKRTNFGRWTRVIVVKNVRGAGGGYSHTRPASAVRGPCHPSPTNNAHASVHASAQDVPILVPGRVPTFVLGLPGMCIGEVAGGCANEG